METKANYVVVGIFTILAVLAGFGFVYWTAGIGERGETATLRVRIPGSANGLGRGSAVLFNGIKVGDVTRVFIDVENPGVAIADAEIDRLTPITTSTEANIGIAGLTGQANIELSGGNLSETKLLDQAEAEGRVAEIVADPSAVTNLLKTAQDIFERADNVLTQLEGFTTDARAPLSETVENARKFSQALADNADDINNFLASVGALSDEVAGVAGKLDGTVEAAEGLLRSIDQAKVATIVENVETFSRDLTRTSAQFDEVVRGVESAVASFEGVARKSTDTLTKVDQVIAGVDPEAVRQIVGNIQEASATARRAAADVARLTETVGGRSEDIDQALVSFRQLGARLNETSLRVDGVLARVDTLLGPEQAGSVVTEARSTLAAYRRTAEELSARVDTLLDPQRPESLVNDVKRTLESYRQVADTANARVGAILGEVENIVGSGQARGVITDARETLRSYKQVADTLNGRLGSILTKVDDLVGSEQVRGVLTDASEALRAFRQAATTINARAGVIADNLSRFSGQGLREVEALVRDGRRAVNRIEQAVTDLGRNPQRILTGGEGAVREYDGRARR